MSVQPLPPYMIRNDILSALRQILKRLKSPASILQLHNASEEAVGLYLDLLIGDQQIRRVVGQLPAPTEEFCEARSQRAVSHLCQLLSGQVTNGKISG